MKERLGMQFDPIKDIPTFQGREYPRTYHFRNIEEPQEWQIVGNASGIGPDQLLVWSDGGVVAMSEERYGKGPTNQY